MEDKWQDLLKSEAAPGSEDSAFLHKESIYTKLIHTQIQQPNSKLVPIQSPRINDKVAKLHTCIEWSSS